MSQERGRVDGSCWWRTCGEGLGSSQGDVMEESTNGKFLEVVDCFFKTDKLEHIQTKQNKTKKRRSRTSFESKCCVTQRLPQSSNLHHI